MLRIDEMGQGQNEGHHIKDVSMIMQVTDDNRLEDDKNGHIQDIF